MIASMTNLVCYLSLLGCLLKPTIGFLHYETTPNGFTSSPKGWNSFALTSLKDGPKLNQDLIVTQCGAMADLLGSYGYQYCSLDSGWSVGRSGDEYGRIIADTTVFPAGMQALGDYLHGKGLLLGIYILPGYFTDDADKTIFGTDITLRSITAPGDNQYLLARWNIAWDSEGAQAYCNSNVDLWASWGVDLIKLDYVTPGSTDEGLPADSSGAVSCYHRAIQQNGRSIRLDISWKLDRTSGYYDIWKNNADSLRLDQDVNNSGESTLVSWGTVQRAIEQYRQYTLIQMARGTEIPLTIYPDMDNLLMGNEESLSGLDDLKRKAMFSHWIGAGANLILGSDMTKIDTYGQSLLTNALAQEIIGFTAKYPMQPIFGNDNTGKGEQYQAWVAGPDPDSGVVVVVLANYGTDGDANLFASQPTDDQYDIILYLDYLAPYGTTYTFEDVWEPEQTQTFDPTQPFTFTVKHSNAILARLTPVTTLKERNVALKRSDAPAARLVRTPSSTVKKPRQIDTTLITQSTYPIASPGCQSRDLPKFPSAIKIDNTSVTPNELLYRLRAKLCSPNCVAPDGVPAKDVAIVQDDNVCEISVGVTAEVEAYAYRTTQATGVELQECWDSSAYIIDKCVKNGPYTGWWNGDHVYQFYQLGYRALNDNSSGHASASSKISSFLGSATGNLTATFRSTTSTIGATSTITNVSVTTLPTALTGSSTATVAPSTTASSTSTSASSSIISTATGSNVASGTTDVGSCLAWLISLALYMMYL